MKVWIVVCTSPFGLGSAGKRIVEVFAHEEDANEMAAKDILFTAASYKVTKKVKKAKGGKKEKRHAQDQAS
jgi:hypothetical protein